MSVLNQIFPKLSWEQLDPLWVGLPYFSIFSDSKQFSYRIFYQSVSKKGNNLDFTCIFYNHKKLQKYQNPPYHVHDHGLKYQILAGVMQADGHQFEHLM